MNPGQILGEWERHHGRLDDTWCSRFLADERVLWLSDLDDRVVLRAIKRHKKLGTICDSAWIEIQQPRGNQRNPIRAAREPRRESDPDQVWPTTSERMPNGAGECGACGMRYGHDGRCLC